jgi:ABC-type transporter Mla subunit MlaD
LRNEIIVGSFICLGIGLFVLLLFLMGTLDPLIERTENVEADFENVQGLQEGDPVFLFGMKAGKVNSVTLLPRREGERAAIRVGFTLPARYRPYLRTGSTTKIDKTLTGNISMVIEDGDGEVLAADGRLRGLPSADFAAVTQKAREVLQEGERVVITLSRIVGDLERSGALAAGVEDLAGITREVRRDLGPVREKLVEGIDLFRSILEENRFDLRHAVSRLRETSDLARSFSDRLQPIPDMLGASLGELERAGATVASAVAENRPHLDTIIEDLRATATNAANLSAEVKRRPWQLLYRPGASERAALELYDAAWAYNLGATELNRSVRLLASCMENERDPEKLRLAYEQLHASLFRQQQAEDVFWSRLRAGN